MKTIKFRQPTYLKGKFQGFHHWGFFRGQFVAPITGHKDMSEIEEESQQFIEEYDTKGNMIFAGDIVTAKSRYDDGEDRTAQFEVTMPDPMFMTEVYDYTVIGNTVENPELGGQ